MLVAVLALFLRAAARAVLVVRPRLLVLALEKLG
jgi:hypothetical protein